jgi:hypothetical protein
MQEERKCRKQKRGGDFGRNQLILQSREKPVTSRELQTNVLLFLQGLTGNRSLKSISRWRHRQVNIALHIRYDGGREKRWHKPQQHPVTSLLRKMTVYHIHRVPLYKSWNVQTSFQMKVEVKECCVYVRHVSPLTLQEELTRFQYESSQMSCSSYINQELQLSLLLVAS